MRASFCAVLLTGMTALSNTAAQSSVAEIPEQHALTSTDNTFGNVPPVYYFMGKPGPNAATSTLPMCGQVLQPHHITYVLNFKGYVKQFFPGCGDLCPSFNPDVHYIPLEPTSSSVPALGQIATCNPNQDKACPACIEGGVGYETSLRVFRVDTDYGMTVATLSERTTTGLLLDVRCFHMRQVDCGASFCTNGEYASEYLKQDARGFVISRTRCLPCAPGTWLTCLNDANCAYDIPSSPGAFEGGGQIYMPSGEDPVGACFGCDSAGGNKIHYGKTNIAVGLPMGSASPLPWYCPGGWLPPVLCKQPFAGSNAKHTFCACKPGLYYTGGAAACAACEPGFMCPDGVKTECPDDTYQDRPGASECNSCLFEGGGTANVCDVSGLKLQRCRGAAKSQPLKCFACNACRHPEESDSAGVLDCY